MSFESGETMLSLYPSPTDIQMIKGNKKFQIGDFQTPTLQMVFFNNQSTNIKDIKIRQALSLAMDRASILKVAAGGYGSVTDGYWAKRSLGYTKIKVGSTNFYRYDMAAAKKLIAKSSAPKGFTMKFNYNPSQPVYTTYSQMLKNEWAQLGVTVELNPMDTATLTANNTKGTYEASTASSSNPDPSKQLNAIDSRLWWNVANPCCGFKGGDAFLKLVDGAKFSINAATRSSFYAKLNSFLIVNVPEIPVYSPNTNVLAVASLKGIQLHMMSSPVVRYVYESK